VKALRLLLCLAVAACAELGTRPWFRVDGNPASPEQLDLDKTTCRQEMERSVQATTSALRSDVYETCMGRLGYTDKKNQRFTAPAAVQVGAAPPAAQVGAAPPAAQVGAAPAAARGTTPPPVQSSPPPADQQCRTPKDLRMWLPLCP
jgi:hypothetical protein